MDTRNQHHDLSAAKSTSHHKGVLPGAKGLIDLRGRGFLQERGQISESKMVNIVHQLWIVSGKATAPFLCPGGTSWQLRDLPQATSNFFAVTNLRNLSFRVPPPGPLVQLLRAIAQSRTCSSLTQIPPPPTCRSGCASQGGSQHYGFQAMGIGYCCKPTHLYPKN